MQLKLSTLITLSLQSAYVTSMLLLSLYHRTQFNFSQLAGSLRRATKAMTRVCQHKARNFLFSFVNCHFFSLFMLFHFSVHVSLKFIEDLFFSFSYKAASALMLVLQSIFSLSVAMKITPNDVNHSTHFPTSINANVSLTNWLLMPGR